MKKLELTKKIQYIRSRCITWFVKYKLIERNFK